MKEFEWIEFFRSIAIVSYNERFFLPIHQLCVLSFHIVKQQRNDDKQTDKILQVNCRLNTNHIIFPFVAQDKQFCDDPHIIFDLFLFNASSSVPILKYLTKT